MRHGPLDHKHLVKTLVYTQRERDLRVVLTHHAIFAFNRGGIDGGKQTAAAWLARQVAFSGGDTARAPTAWTPPRRS